MDYSGYPDCRPEFIESFQQTANLTCKLFLKDNVTIQAPLMYLTKAEIIQIGFDLNVPYHLTHSCYDPINGKACGHCDSCLLRMNGFKQAEVTDPTVYF